MAVADVHSFDSFGVDILGKTRRELNWRLCHGVALHWSTETKKPGTRPGIYSVTFGEAD